MRWIKKEFNDDGKPEWAVYNDEAGEGRQEDWSHYDTFETRDEAIKGCGRVTWEDYDCSDK